MPQFRQGNTFNFGEQRENAKQHVKRHNQNVNLLMKYLVAFHFYEQKTSARQEASARREPSVAGSGKEIVRVGNRQEKPKRKIPEASACSFLSYNYLPELHGPVELAAEPETFQIGNCYLQFNGVVFTGN
ncbi:hypothetical protein B0H11DRAFT_1921308 [Mycena galericulata]|nr:hypothetical protein B0H11DRAFT_1921308 [Mycena galericulata]